MLRLGLVIVALLAISPRATAHDFYLSPSAHVIEPGGTVSIFMYVGTDKELDELPRSDRRVKAFDAHPASGAVLPVPGKHGSSPAGTIKLTEPGLTMIAFRSSYTDIELDA